jgi:hypothetical protein
VDARRHWADVVAHDSRAATLVPGIDVHDTTRHLHRLAGGEETRFFFARLDSELAVDRFVALHPVTMQVRSGLPTPRPQHALDHRSLWRQFDHAHHRSSVRACPFLARN